MKHLLGALAALALTVAFALTAPAHAANCSNYTYTLTNGQTADATQVMSNFNSILSCANSNLAKNGSNSDITALSGLVTPLSVGQGGTGGTTGATAAASLGVLPLAGGTMTGKLVTSAPTTGGAGLNLPHGVAPTSPANGDLWSTTAGVFAEVNGAQTILTPQLFWVRNAQNNGVADTETGPSAATWTQRVLNNVVVNGIPGASLSSNQITLPAGTYEVFFMAPISSNNANNTIRQRVRDVTDGLTLAVSTGFNGAGGGDIVQTSLFGAFALAGTTVVEIDWWVKQGGVNVPGASSSGEVEVYSEVYIRRIG